MERKLDILVVDDERDFLDTIIKRLGRKGYSAQGAGSAEEALDMLERLEPDAVILDVMLPGMDGIECLRRIKAMKPALPVILLTGHASMRAGVEGVAAGASDYCMKPVDFERLMELVVIACREG